MKPAGGLPGNVDRRRSELEHALVNIQRERVALTEAFTLLGGERMTAGIETLIIRLLRLQRSVKMARKSAAA